MNAKIPTLTGWVNTVEEKADYILSCFITSNHSQSVLFRGNNTSLQYLVKQYSGDHLSLERELRTILESKMSIAFDGNNTNVNVIIDRTDEISNNMTIRFNCTVSVDGREFIVGKAVQYIDSRIVRISKLTNG